MECDFETFEFHRRRGEKEEREDGDRSEPNICPQNPEITQTYLLQLSTTLCLSISWLSLQTNEIWSSQVHFSNVQYS